MSGFFIDLAGIPTGSSAVQLESGPEELGLSATEWPGRVQGAFNVEKSGDRVAVRGELSAVAALECVRCLKSYELPVRVPFDVFAERSGTHHRLEEVELERGDYMSFHDGRRLDLREEAREALMLEIPMAPHCREDCRGLCPRCGADRNEGPCRCETVETADRPPDNSV